MKFSIFGERAARGSGIEELMEDLGNAMSGHSDMIMMGGGNPAHIPAILDRLQELARELVNDRNRFTRMMANYDTPQGNREFIDSLAAFFHNRLGWKVNRDNIMITNGSQNAFYYLFNLFGGQYADGSYRRILFPLCPEYIGYADQGLSEGFFISHKPVIESRGSHRFKYHVDMNALENAPHNIGAVCVSRPSNPSGNVISADEMHEISAFARRRGIPFLVDNAYGYPFPGIIFDNAPLEWEEHMVLSLSLSKLGLPGARTGIVLAAPEIIQAMVSAHAVLALANGNLGPSLLTSVIENGEILDWSEKTVRPFYAARSAQALAWLDEMMPSSLPWKVHESQGALFLWLWLPGLPGGGQNLYEKLKDKGVLIVPGHYFFTGIDEEWPHRNECVRLTYSQDPDQVREGIRILSETVAELYGM